MTEVLQPTMTVEELAAILRVQPAVIYKEVSAGNLPGFKIGKQLRFNPAVIKLWMQRMSAAQNRSRYLYEHTVSAWDDNKLPPVEGLVTRAQVGEDRSEEHTSEL